MPTLPKDGTYLASEGSAFDTRSIQLTGLQRLIFMVWHDELTRQYNYDFSDSPDAVTDWDTIRASVDDMLDKVMSQNLVVQDAMKIITPKTYLDGSTNSFSVDWSEFAVSEVEIVAYLQQSGLSDEEGLGMNVSGVTNNNWLWQMWQLQGNAAIAVTSGTGYTWDNLRIPNANYSHPARFMFRLSNVDADQIAGHHTMMTVSNQRHTGTAFGYNTILEARNSGIGGVQTAQIFSRYGALFTDKSWFMVRGW